jgi:hypothetical protein
MTSMRIDGATSYFEADPVSSSRARRFVVATLSGHGLDRFCDDAALCAAELATNAILHSRTPFTVAVRPISAGVRIDVQDDRPDRLPVEIPDDLPPLASGTTGRGLRLVSAMSTRWGYFTTDVAKTVWVELGDHRHEGSTPALVEVAARPAPVAGRSVRLVDLPVGAAVASGVQIDDLVREVQLQPERIGPEERIQFHSLLERSAAPRLIGRQEAFRAAGRGLDRYTLELTVSADELAAVGELVGFLSLLARTSDLEAGLIPPDVEAMRAWLPEEVAAQYEGREPTPFPGGSAG